MTNIDESVGGQTMTYRVPDIMTAALQFIEREYDIAYWNNKQDKCPSPFSNWGTSLITPVFEVHSYSWGDDEQPYNFKWRDLRVSWYKRLGRGMTSNIEVTPQMVHECLTECLDEIRPMWSDKSRFIEVGP